MAQQVQFVQLTQSEYDALASKDAGKLYFTSDTGRIYKGSVLYAATTFDQLVADSIEASEITVDGDNVSLEGHTHSVEDIVDIEDVRYSLVTPTQTTSGTTVSVTLQDRAVNLVQLASTVTQVNMTFPAVVTGKSRDFFVRLVVTGQTAPEVSFQESTGTAPTFDTDDDEWDAIEPGVNILMFTETNQ